MIVLIILFANLVAPYGPDDQDIMAKNLAPSLQHLAGTDHLGRDVFSRILYGGRVSISIGIFASVVTTLAGAIIGSISAYFGGKVDNVIMRLCDVWGAMLSAGRNYLRDYPWQVLGPGIAMFLTLFSLNVPGDGVRDALDPKLKD